MSGCCWHDLPCRALPTSPGWFLRPPTSGRLVSRRTWHGAARVASAPSICNFVPGCCIPRSTRVPPFRLGHRPRRERDRPAVRPCGLKAPELLTRHDARTCVRHRRGAVTAPAGSRAGDAGAGEPPDRDVIPSPTFSIQARAQFVMAATPPPAGPSACSATMTPRCRMWFYIESLHQRPCTWTPGPDLSTTWKSDEPASAEALTPAQTKRFFTAFCGKPDGTELRKSSRVPEWIREDHPTADAQFSACDPPPSRDSDRPRQRRNRPGVNFFDTTVPHSARI